MCDCTLRAKSDIYDCLVVVVVVNRSFFCVELESERRILWDDVLPRFRSRIQSLELDVHLVDVHHVGAMSPAESHLDGHAHLCHLDVIRDCHRVSCGTFFLVSSFRQALCDIATATVVAAAAAA